MGNQKTTKVPNDLMDKYLNLFEKPEQYQAILDLIKQTYELGYKDGENDQYDKFFEY